MEIVFPPAVNKNSKKLTEIGWKYQVYFKQDPVSIIRVLLKSHKGQDVPGIESTFYDAYIIGTSLRYFWTVCLIHMHLNDI